MGDAPSPFAGIVLAGGEGRRMGRPKAGVRLGGVPLVDRAVALLAPLCPAGVVVVTRPGRPRPAGGAGLLVDRAAGEGPLGALATGLAVVVADEVLVLGCDLPFAGPALTLLATGPRGAAVATAPGHGPQPLCARYPRARALAAAEALLGAGERRLRALPVALAARAVEASPAALANLNTPADLATASELVRREPAAGADGGAAVPAHPSRAHPWARAAAATASQSVSCADGGGRTAASAGRLVATMKASRPPGVQISSIRQPWAPTE